jgi:predicted transcriptional regulator YdeE
MGRYNEELAKAGIMLDGAGLTPSSQGARVHFSGTQRTVIDGPFAETKELIAGYWVWRVQSLQEAIDWVKKCPNPMHEDSDIEIRPYFEAEDFGEAFTPELREQEAATRAVTLGLNAPTFQSGPELQIAGINRSYTPETRTSIPQQWEEFVPRAASIPGQNGAEYYGVCWNTRPGCQFDYLTGVAVNDAAKLPAGMTSVTLSARRYAVFVHRGHVSAIGNTIDTIWVQWAPECSLKVAAGAPCFERYTAAFNPRTGLGGMEIWIPLEK